jgi:hypothetical protein
MSTNGLVDPTRARRDVAADAEGVPRAPGRVVRERGAGLVPVRIADDTGEGGRQGPNPNTMDGV